MSVVIKVENLSKQYRLGTIGTGTLSHDLNRWWHRVRGKEDPYLKVSQVNDRVQKASGEYVWALRNIDFEINRGDVVGIIGKNGAGKSTLLKILSRTTLPTAGTVKAKGRIASLLEVGTGFHPELTGRENIFLNGAILGMRKTEIQQKFDEIVAFAGVEKYVDTPVKRYSSGMYVRLAFAVAAHLEPEILIIDEVLAVGDAEFQKKCLGKMKDVSEQGRTVLFVSHNMTAVNTLCSSCIFLKNGQIVSRGDTQKIVNEYLSSEVANRTSVQWNRNDAPGDDVAILLSARLIDEQSRKIEYAKIDNQIGIEFSYELLVGGYAPVPNIHVHTSKNEYAFVSAGKESGPIAPGVYTSVVTIPAHLLNSETYNIRIALTSMNPLKVHFALADALVFEVIEDINTRQNSFNQRIPGIIRPQLNWNTIKIK